MDLCLKINSDVYRACFQHALTTSSEEVMGLLLGETNYDERHDKTHLEILGIRIDRRLDKKPDRVEISPEQMVEAAEAAEKLSQSLERPNIRVIGWYHSHPNITIWPSHVDLRTQYNFQTMDKHFLGLIFSVFDVEKSKHSHSFQMVAFQAEEKFSSGLEQVLIPFEIVNTPMTKHVGKEMVRISDILAEENSESASKAWDNPNASENLLAQAKIHSVVQSGYMDILETITLPTMTQLKVECEQEFDFDHRPRKALGLKKIPNQ